jgi:hypothetical protein
MMISAEKLLHCFVGLTAKVSLQENMGDELSFLKETQQPMIDMSRMQCNAGYGVMVVNACETSRHERPAMEPESSTRRTL